MTSIYQAQALNQTRDPGERLLQDVDRIAASVANCINTGEPQPEQSGTFQAVCNQPAPPALTGTRLSRNCWLAAAQL